MFAAETEITLANVLTLLMMSAAILGGIWAWHRFSLNKPLQEDIRESLKFLPDSEKPMVPLVSLLCIFIWFIVPEVYMWAWGAKFDVEPAKFKELPKDWQLLNLDLLFAIRLILIGVVLAMAFAQRRIGLADCGFRKDQLFDQIKSGWYCFLLAMPLVVVMTLLTAPIRSEERVHELIQVMHQENNLRIYILVGLSAIVLAPLTEELLFRVCLQGSWQEKNPSLAIVITAMLFAFVHGSPDLYPLIPLSLILGALYYYKRSFLACVAMHSTFNAFYFVLTLVSTVGGEG